MAEYRAKRLLDMRLALGGHCFTLFGEHLEQCLGCHVILPRWAVKEGLGHQFGLARWCPALMRALPSGD